MTKSVLSIDALHAGSTRSSYSSGNVNSDITSHSHSMTSRTPKVNPTLKPYYSSSTVTQHTGSSLISVSPSDKIIQEDPGSSFAVYTGTSIGGVFILSGLVTLILILYLCSRRRSPATPREFQDIAGIPSTELLDTYSTEYPMYIEPEGIVPSTNGARQSQQLLLPTNASLMAVNIKTSTNRAYGVRETTHGRSPAEGIQDQQSYLEIVHQEDDKISEESMYNYII